MEPTIQALVNNILNLFRVSTAKNITANAPQCSLSWRKILLPVEKISLMALPIYGLNQ